MSTEGPATAPATGRASPTPQAVVLVVDDDPDIGDSIGDVLRSGGYQVEIVADGQAAVEVAREKRVGMVLLDWRLPTEPCGGALVRRLRDICGFGVPVVVLSADPTSLVEAREAQVSDYLPKPFEVDDLLHLVDSYCPP